MFRSARKHFKIDGKRKKSVIPCGQKNGETDISSDEFRKLYEDLGYSQVGFAALLGVSRAAIARAVAKKGRGPSKLVLSRLEICRLTGKLAKKSENV